LLVPSYLLKLGLVSQRLEAVIFFVQLVVVCVVTLEFVLRVMVQAS
jgi:hypothetical protein